MKPDQFEAAIEKLGYKPVEIGEEIGVSKRQGQRYVSGVTPVPEPTAMLLRAALRYGFKLKDVRR